MTSALPSRRAMCAACLRPQLGCLCGWVARVASAVDVLILQHPLEVGNAKGTARLLHLSLPGSTMIAGEVHAQDTLSRLLYGGERTPLLLYPDTPGDNSLGIAAPPALDPALLRTPQTVRLVVLDGTWRKSRKMLYLNPMLQALPRLSLDAPPASRYVIRKAHAPEQRSTLEATVYALMQLEAGSAEKFAPLLAALDGYVAAARLHHPR